MVRTDGSNDVTVNVYDNTTNSGKRLIPEDTVIRGDMMLDGVGYDPPVFCENGVYVEVSTSGSCS